MYKQEVNVMEKPIRMYKIKGTDKVVRLYPENDPSSPREDSNLGKMICSHKRYNLGDEQIKNTDDFGSWDEIEKWLLETKDIYFMYPLYLYDHSGITISINPFGCRWDSGQVGFIYALKADVKEEGMTLEGVKDALKAEVECYDQYLIGDIYEFVVEHDETCDKCGNTERMHDDSCFGFYGYDIKTNGMLDHIGVKFEELEEVDVDG